MLINEIVYSLSRGSSQNNSLKHINNYIFWYGFNNIFNKLYKPYVRKNTGTYEYYINKYGVDAAEERYKKGTEITSLWISQNIRNPLYPTQKSYKLLERIICLSTV